MFTAAVDKFWNTDCMDYINGTTNDRAADGTVASFDAKSSQVAVPVVGGNAPGYLVAIIALVLGILAYFFWPDKRVPPQNQ